MLPVRLVLFSGNESNPWLRFHLQQQYFASLRPEPFQSLNYTEIPLSTAAKPFHIHHVACRALPAKLP